MDLAVHCAVLTHPGRRRANNEDFVAFFEPDDPLELEQSGCLYLVADGVGGAARGERASQFAAEKVLYSFFNDRDPDLGARLRRAMRQVGNDIYLHMERTGDGARMATTLVAAAVRGRSLLVANVGDSRAYLIRGGTASQITHDHTVAGEMLRDGEIDEVEARHFKGKNRLTRSLGGEMDVPVDVFGPLALEAGDRVVLCTDGLGRYALQRDIAALAAEGGPEDVAHHCIDFANDKGGADNISVAVIQVGDVPAYAAPTVRRRALPPEPVDWDALETMPSVRGYTRPWRRRRGRLGVVPLIAAGALTLGAIGGGIALLDSLWNPPGPLAATPSIEVPTPTDSPGVAPAVLPDVEGLILTSEPFTVTPTPGSADTPTGTPPPNYNSECDLAFESEWKPIGELGQEFISGEAKDGKCILTASKPLSSTAPSPFWFVPNSPELADYQDYQVETSVGTVGQDCPDGAYFGVVVRYREDRAKDGLENGYGVEIRCNGDLRVIQFNPDADDMPLPEGSGAWVPVDGWEKGPPWPITLQVTVQGTSLVALANGQPLCEGYLLSEKYPDGGPGLYAVTAGDQGFMLAFDYLRVWTIPQSTESLPQGGS